MQNEKAKPGASIIELIGASKSYGDVGALHPTDLAIASGRTTVLIGPSGCGKSTLLRLIIGLIGPETGSVRFEGTEVTRSNVQALRHRMGYVIQEGGLFPHLTARRNVTLLSQHLGRDRAWIDGRVRELSALTHFPDDGLERYPAQLSGGQRQRVSLMRALMLDPDVLLLDEPLGSLDPMIRFDLQTDLREVFQTLGKSVVMVTHDLGEAEFFGDTIVLMKSGRIVQQGAMDDLLGSPADPFVTAFIRAQRRGPGEGGG